ncbi:MAG: N-acetyltransferase [Anaerolineaceae bacterium]
MKINLRHELPEDYRTVEELTREAFWNLYVPGCSEHYLLHRMRDAQAFIPELDLVAEFDGKLIGNIVYCKARIVGDDGVDHDVLTFGPVSVLPEFQKKGVGSALINETLNQAKALGYKAVLIYGSPDYYQRFGFLPAEDFDIRTADDMVAAALQALELIPGGLRGKSGRFIEGATFEFDTAEVEPFDNTFPAKQKLEGTPSQQAFLSIASQRKPRT